MMNYYSSFRTQEVPPEHGNSSEKSRLSTCRPANITTCWNLLFGLLCFHVERPEFDGQIHFSRWPSKFKKEVFCAQLKRRIIGTNNYCSSNLIKPRLARSPSQRD